MVKKRSDSYSSFSGLFKVKNKNNSVKKAKKKVVKKVAKKKVAKKIKTKVKPIRVRRVKSPSLSSLFNVKTVSVRPKLKTFVKKKVAKKIKTKVKPIRVRRIKSPSLSSLFNVEKPSVRPKLKTVVKKKVVKKIKTVKVKNVELPVKFAKKIKSKNGFGKNRIKLGIPGVNALFDKGIPDGSIVLVEGGPGSGKTIFCLQEAIEACKKGNNVLYMSFEEPEYRLKSHMKSFGWDPETYEKKGNLMIKRFSALDIARSVEALLSEAKKELLIDVQPVLIPEGFEPNIVFIDSLSAIAAAFSGEESRFRIYMEQLFRYLESHEITSFLIREVANPSHIGMTAYVEKGEAVSFLSDGIIVCYNVIYPSGKRGRAFELLKMRGENIDRRIVEATIGKKGITIHPNRSLRGKYSLT